MSSVNNVNVFRICDAEGRLVAEHVRKDGPAGKRMSWRQPDGSPGLNGMRGEELPLYGAQLLAELDEDDLVTLVEGEKCCDALAGVGIKAVATCTGAGGTPGPGALEVLRGQEVTLWPDADKVGREHMERIAQRLQGVAALVRWYEWPEAPEDVKGADAFDHPAVRSGNPKAVDRLLDDLMGAPTWEPEEREGHTPKGLVFRTAREVAEAAPAEVPFLVRPFVVVGAITELVGQIKRAGKTTFALAMCRKVLDGEPFMGEKTTKTPVVYLTEQPTTSFVEALKRADLQDRDDFHILEWRSTLGMPWSEVAHVATEKALELGAGLLCVDTLAQFAGLQGDRENDAGAALAAMKPLQEAAGHGLSVVVIRHERKGGGEVGQSARGSTAFGGVVDTIMTLRRSEGDARPTLRKLEALSRFGEVPDTLMVELADGQYRALGSETAVASVEARREILKVAPVSENWAEPMDVIFEKACVARATGYKVLTELVDEGEIVRVGKGHKGSPYLYHRSDPPGDDGSEKLPFPTVGGVGNESKPVEDNPPSVR